MSALVGVLALDGRRVEPESLWLAIGESGGRRPRPWRRWSAGPVALATSATLIEEDREGTGGSLPGPVLVGDIRLDNRQELATLLGREGRAARHGAEDGVLLLAAYRRWGVDCLARLVGDFSFAIWDPAGGGLLCARDPLGVRQLVYSLDGDRLLFATRAAAVAVARGGAVRPRRELLRDMLCKRYGRWIDQTAFAEVSRLPAGHCLTVRSGSLKVPRVRRYWPAADRTVQPGLAPSEYADQFGELLQEAVRSRLRGGAPVGLLLSGGLDSSSIACLAERLALPRAPLLAYTAIYPRSPTADEREHLATVIAHCPTLRGSTINGDDCAVEADIVGTPVWLPDEPLVDAGSPLLRALLSRAREDGCAAVLAGTGADQALLGEAYYAAGLVRDLDWSRLRGEIPHFKGRSTLPWWRFWAAATVGRFLPGRWFHRFAGAKSLRSRGDKGASEVPEAASRSAELIWQELFGGLATARGAALDQLAHDEGIEWRFPFLDSRAVRFCLDLPAGLHFQGGFDKALLRGAMLGILPESIRARTRPAHFSEPLHRHLAGWNRDKVWSELCETLVGRYGLLSAVEWKRIESLQEAGVAAKFDFRRFLLLLATATWLRQCEARFGSRWSWGIGGF